MKKQTAVTIAILVALLVGAGTVSAQTAVQADASSQTDVTTGGGLGKGIKSMVRGILGDEPTQTIDNAPAAKPSVMMQINAKSDPNGSVHIAPQSAARAMKSAVRADAASMTDAQLSEYIHALILEDSNIQSIDSSDSHVRITYVVPSRVFRFLRITLRVTVGATASGATEVTYPWYAFDSTHTMAELKADVAAHVEQLIPKNAFTPLEQKMLIDQIHVALVSKLGTSTAGDR